MPRRSSSSSQRAPWNKGQTLSASHRQNVSLGRKKFLQQLAQRGERLSWSARQRGKQIESHRGQIPWNKGKSLSVEHRQRISQKNKGRTAPNKGKPMADGLRQQISAKLKGRKRGPISAEHKRRIAEGNRGRVSPMRGKTHSAEARRKMSAANIGRVPWNKGGRLSFEHRERISLGLTGKKPTPQHRANVRLGQKRLWKDLRARMRKHFIDTGQPIMFRLPDRKRQAKSLGVRPAVDVVQAKEKIRVVHEVVDRLPKNCRAAVTFVVFEENTIDEAALRMGRSRATVVRLLKKAKEIMARDPSLRSLVA